MYVLQNKRKHKRFSCGTAIEALKLLRVEKKIGEAKKENSNDYCSFKRNSTITYAGAIKLS